MVSDVNILAPTITLAVGIVIGYSCRSFIAIEEKKALDEAEEAYTTLLNRIRSQAASKIAKVEKAL